MNYSVHDGPKKQTALEKLNQTWNENPIMVIGIATGAVMAVAKLIDAVSAAQGRRAYAKQINLKANRRGRQKKVDYTS